METRILSFVRSAHREKVLIFRRARRSEDPQGYVHRLRVPNRAAFTQQPRLAHLMWFAVLLHHVLILLSNVVAPNGHLSAAVVEQLVEKCHFPGVFDEGDDAMHALCQPALCDSVVNQALVGAVMLQDAKPLGVRAKRRPSTGYDSILAFRSVEQSVAAKSRHTGIAAYRTLASTRYAEGASHMKNASVLALAGSLVSVASKVTRSSANAPGGGKAHVSRAPHTDKNAVGRASRRAKHTHTQITAHPATSVGDFSVTLNVLRAVVDSLFQFIEKRNVSAGEQSEQQIVLEGKLAMQPFLLQAGTSVLSITLVLTCVCVGCGGLFVTAFAFRRQETGSAKEDDPFAKETTMPFRHRISRASRASGSAELSPLSSPKASPFPKEKQSPKASPKSSPQTPSRSPGSGFLSVEELISKTTRSTLASQHLCPQLQVPRGCECSLRIHDEIQRDGGLQISDGEGNTVLSATMCVVEGMTFPPYGSTRVVLYSPAGNLLARCCSVDLDVGDDQWQAHLLRPDGRYYGTLVRQRGRLTSWNFLLTSVIGEHMHFRLADTPDEAFVASDQNGTLLAMTEPRSPELGVRMLRVAPGVDVGLVLCCSLCLRVVLREDNTSDRD